MADAPVDVARAALQDLAHDLLLASYSVDGDDGAPDVEEVEQLRNRGDLVRLLVGLDLPDDEP